jgi:hypothetical protein
MRVVGETIPEYLARSTWANAREHRRVVNSHVDALPLDCGAAICRRLRTDPTPATEVELLVGRFLQLRGATSLICHPGVNGPRVDWRATFPDGALDVEVMAPVFEAEISQALLEQARVIQSLAPDVPTGWSLWPHQLPKLSGHSSTRRLRAVLREKYKALPDPERGRRVDLVAMLDDERIEVTMVVIGGDPIARWGMAGGLVDPSLRIEAAWLDERKRRQGRSARQPAILALAGNGWSDDRDGFARGLFGYSGRGVMARESDPPWAGVLVFPRMHIAGASEPALFRAPAYVADLPNAIGRLETWTVENGIVQVAPPQDPEAWAGMEWARDVANST